MRYVAAFCSLVLTACATPHDGNIASSLAARRLQTAIIREEAAFMAATRSEGLMPAFAKRAHGDAIMFLPGPVRIAERLATEKWAGVVSWAPAFVVTSADGQLGLSTGPSSWAAGGKDYPGYYITIWQRQADGSLRFVFDSSADLPADLYADRSGQIEHIAGDRGSVSVARSRTLLTTAIARSDAGASPPYHPRARLLRDGRAPVIGPGPAVSQMSEGEQRSTTAHFVAPSGDFAWSYGEIIPTVSEQPAAHFAQVWLNEGEQWRVILDFRKEMPKR